MALIGGEESLGGRDGPVLATGVDLVMVSCVDVVEVMVAGDEDIPEEDCSKEDTDTVRVVSGGPFQEKTGVPGGAAVGDGEAVVQLVG